MNEGRVLKIPVPVAAVATVAGLAAARLIEMDNGVLSAAIGIAVTASCMAIWTLIEIVRDPSIQTRWGNPER